MKSTQVLLAILIVLGCGTRYSSAQTDVSTQIPSSAVIRFTLDKAPGLGMPKTKWDVSYELRLTTEAELWTASLSGKSKSETVRIGDLVKQGTTTPAIASPDEKTLVIEIPFDKSIQERLRIQPNTRFNITASTVNAENVARLKEQERRSQVFMLYTVVNVHDAKLKKRVVMPISRGWDFADHRDARFNISIEISDDSTYSWKSK